MGESTYALVKPALSEGCAQVNPSRCGYAPNLWLEFTYGCIAGQPATVSIRDDGCNACIKPFAIERLMDSLGPY